MVQLGKRRKFMHREQQKKKTHRDTQNYNNAILELELLLHLCERDSVSIFRQRSAEIWHLETTISIDLKAPLAACRWRRTRLLCSMCLPTVSINSAAAGRSFPASESGFQVNKHSPKQNWGGSFIMCALVKIIKHRHKDAHFLCCRE